MKRLLKLIGYALAAIYLCVDFIFAGVAKPISNWIARHFEMRRLRAWIRSLPPYPSLALFSVPVILLEPVKFVAAYIAATGNFIAALFTFAFGELLKLVLIERLFDLTREKLMKISAFAWIYGHYVQALEWILQSEAWRTIRLMSQSAIQRTRTWRGAVIGSWPKPAYVRSPAQRPPLPARSSEARVPVQSTRARVGSTPPRPRDC
jgi:hypothetical protein